MCNSLFRKLLGFLVLLALPLAVQADGLFFPSVPPLGGTLTNAGGLLNTTQPTNAQTGTTYAMLASDAGTIVTFNNASPVAVSLSQATTNGFTAGYSFFAQNLGVGAVTITPATSTINGAATLVIQKNEGCQITSDGINYQTSSCTAISPPGIYISGVTVTNTAISTSEVNLVSLALPPLQANDKLEVDTLWTQGGTATNTHNIVIRLATSGCTTLTTCNTGTAFLNVNLNSSSLITARVLSAIWNTSATNSQVYFNNAGTAGNGTSSAAIGTAAQQTNATPFVNINCTTASSTADSCAINAYSVRIVRNHAH